MKLIALSSLLVVVHLSVSQIAIHADVIASDRFEISSNLTNRTSSVPLNSNQRFGIFDRQVLGHQAFYDQTVANPFDPGNPVSADEFGIIRSDKTDAFLGLESTTGFVEWEFDISGASELINFQVDMAGMGRFVFANKRWQYKIDDGDFETVAILGDDPDELTYFMEDGSSRVFDRFLRVNGGEIIDNQLTTYTFDDFAGLQGSTLTLRLDSQHEFGGDPFVIDNLVVNGTAAVPEPSSCFMVLSSLGLLFVRRKRRANHE